jgi:hypothetical protein
MFSRKNIVFQNLKNKKESQMTKKSLHSTFWAFRRAFALTVCAAIPVSSIAPSFAQRRISLRVPKGDATLNTEPHRDKEST